MSLPLSEILFVLVLAAAYVGSVVWLAVRPKEAL